MRSIPFCNASSWSRDGTSPMRLICLSRLCTSGRQSLHRLSQLVHAHTQPATFPPLAVRLSIFSQAGPGPYRRWFSAPPHRTCAAARAKSPRAGLAFLADLHVAGRNLAQRPDPEVEAIAGPDFFFYFEHRETLRGLTQRRFHPARSFLFPELVRNGDNERFGHGWGCSASKGRRARNQTPPRPPGSSLAAPSWISRRTA